MAIREQVTEFVPAWYYHNNLGPFVGVAAVFEGITLKDGIVMVAGGMGAIAMTNMQPNQMVTNDIYPYALCIDDNVYNVYTNVKTVSGSAAYGNLVTAINLGDFKSFVVSDDPARHFQGVKNGYYYENVQ